MIDPITAKEEEIAAWEAREIAALALYNDTARAYQRTTAAITWTNCREIVAHLRTQLQAMKRLRLMQEEPS